MTSCSKGVDDVTNGPDDSVKVRGRARVQAQVRVRVGVGVRVRVRVRPRWPPVFVIWLIPVCTPEETNRQTDR